MGLPPSADIHDPIVAVTGGFTMDRVSGGEYGRTHDRRYLRPNRRNIFKYPRQATLAFLRGTLHQDGRSKNRRLPQEQAGLFLFHPSNDRMRGSRDIRFRQVRLDDDVKLERL